MSGCSSDIKLTHTVLFSLSPLKFVHAILSSVWAHKHECEHGTKGKETKMSAKSYKTHK